MTEQNDVRYEPFRNDTPPKPKKKSKKAAKKSK